MWLVTAVSSDEAKSAEFWDDASWGIWNSESEMKNDRHHKLWIYMDLFSCAGVWTRETTDQDWRSREEIIEGVVQQVDAGGGVKICITHQLASEQRLSGTAAQEAAHLAVGYVHPVGQHLQAITNHHIRDKAWLQCSQTRRQSETQLGKLNEEQTTY